MESFMMKTEEVFTFVFKQKNSRWILTCCCGETLARSKSFAFPFAGEESKNFEIKGKRRKKGKENTNYFKRAFLQCNFYIYEKAKSCLRIASGS